MELARIVRVVRRGCLYLWPLPCTALGLGIGFIAERGRPIWIFRNGTVGIVGPRIDRLLRRVPITGGAAAITFGHAILARDHETFRSCFDHEYIHVRQYIWWGPLFLPAYLANSLWHLCRGHDPYRDNAFEKQARRLTGEEFQTGDEATET